MKVAIATQNGEIFQHFGATPEFTVYEIEGGNVLSSKCESTNGTGHGALIDVLLHLKADAVICGGIGGGARNALAKAGIQVFPGVTGNADAAAKNFAEEKLLFNPETSCHEHGHEHTCSGNCH